MFGAVQRSAVVITAPIRDRSLHISLTEHLDDGEAAAITLAMELKARWLILDEREARATAQRLGCRTIGTVGVIALAKVRGLIPAAAPLIQQQIIDKARFHVAADLVRRVLEDLGET